MALDGITLTKVKEDLDRYLPIRINKITQSSKTELVFNVLADSRRTNLVLSFHSNYNHICLSGRGSSTYNEPSTFVMVLRKYILNGIIHQIEQFDHDRYLLMHVRARNELYDEKEYLLSVELMGKYANLVLVNDEGIILDALKKIPPFENTRRTILAGARFTLPDKQDKQDPFTDPHIDLDQSLVKQLAGFSKLLETEVRYRLEKGERFTAIIEQIRASSSLYISRLPESCEFHVIPLTHLQVPYTQWDIQKGFDEIYHEDDEKERIRNIADDLYKVVRRQLKHFQTKITKLQTSLEEALNLQSDKENGEVLYTYHDLEQKGLKELKLKDYEGNEKTIRLDPKLSVKANANRYYAQYQKKRKGKAYIEEQIAIAQSELTYFESLNEQLAMANYTDALDIKEELTRFGYIRNAGKKNNRKKKINLYQIKVGNNTITFGKNNLQNAFLSFEYAHSDHTWLHAKDYHGSHVVIDTAHPDEQLLRTAANIAAFYSQGRYSSSVPVDYCPVRELKKIKGAKPGFVTFKNHKTIYIDPIEPDPSTVISL